MKLHYLVLLRKANLESILSRPDLLAGAKNRPPLEWPKISQAIALVFSILECVSKSNETVLSGTTRKGKSSGDSFLARSAHRSRK